jgi:Family of unknown function (DUF6152)
MKRTSCSLAAIACVTIAATSASAHHAFSAEFDAARPIKFSATVARVEWINPHTWIHVEVKRPNGKVEQWAIEGGTPNVLFRRGITRESLKVGAVLVIEGWQAKNGTNRANGRNITLPDGRKLFLGATDSGAPAP